MKDLIRRLKKATGPDRELDCRIAAAIGWVGISPAEKVVGWYDEQGFLRNDVPRYTESFGEAIRLIPADIDNPTSTNFELSLQQQRGRRNEWDAVIGHGAFDGWDATHRDPVLAILIAALKAREAVQ